MKKNEYLRLKQQIDSEYRRKLEALEMVWSMSQEPDEPSEVSPPTDEFNISQAIRTAIKEIYHKPFRNNDIQELLRRRYPNKVIKTNYISWWIRKMHNKGEIKRLEKGDSNAKKGYIYIKNGHQNNDGHG
jgi:hypothetical protein